MMRKPVCISYLRYSSNRQSKGTSIERQLQLSQQWADKNGFVIDDTLREEKVSAFRGKNAATGKLASIIKRIEQGDIPPKSVLICENLDRLSRQEVGEAVEMFLGIINRGIKVVTVGDDAREYVKPCDMMDVMYAVMSLSRGNEESRTKSSRSLDNWARRRQLAKSGDGLLSSRLPSWLTLNDKGKIVLDKSKAAAVKKCFDLALKGYGVGAIVRTLNADKIPPPAGGEMWYTRFVWRLFREEAVIGVKITKRFDNGKRIEVDRIANYYPAVIDEKKYAAVGAMMSGRRNRKYGHRESNQHYNIFRDLLTDDKGNHFASINRPNGTGTVRYLVSMGAWSKRTEKWHYLREDIFSQAFFEVFANHFENAFDRKADNESLSDIESAMSDLHKLDTQITKIEDQLVNLESSPAALRVLAKLEAKRNEMAQRVKSAQASSALSSLEVARSSFDRLFRLLTDDMTYDERVEVGGIVRQYVKSIVLKTQTKILVTTSKDKPKKNAPWLIGDCSIHLRSGGKIDFQFQYPNGKTDGRRKLASLEVTVK